MIFEIVLLTISTLSLFSVFIIVQVLNVYHLKQNILTQEKKLTILIRHLTDLTFFTENNAENLLKRKEVLQAQDINHKVEEFQKIIPKISKVSAYYPRLYVQALEDIHLYNNNIASLKKIKNSILSKALLKLLIPNYSGLKSLSLQHQ